MYLAVYLAWFLTTIFTVIATDVSCKGKRGLQWVAHPSDCSTYFLCFNEAKLTYTCPEKTVRDLVSKACIPQGSASDDCSSKNAEVICSANEQKKPARSGHCGKYIDCVTLRKPGATPVSAEMECDYPMVFDEDTKRCQPPEVANCGTRPIPKNPCDYEANQCKTAQCRPCHIRFPSCEGMKDGLNHWAGREMSPYYVVCKDERVVFQGMCSTDKKMQLFDSEQKMCVEQK